MRMTLHRASLAIERAIDRTPAGSRRVALARTLIAAAQLSVLLATRWDALFVATGAADAGPECEGVSEVGAYCLLRGTGSTDPATIVIIVGLMVVLSGYLPRYMGLVHVWLTISLSSSITLPDGGESVAQIVVLLLAVVTLADPRTNHWQPDRWTRSALVPVAWATGHIIRLQLVWIYVNAAVTKTAVTEWKDGTAIYYLTMDPMFGTAGPLAGLFDAVAYTPVGALAMSWGAIVIEVSIALLLLGPARHRPLAFWGSVLLHGLFIVMIGLWSFALVMIGAVLAAGGPTLLLRRLLPARERQAVGGHGERPLGVPARDEAGDVTVPDPVGHEMREKETR